MPLQPDSDLKQIGGIGAQRARAFAKRGIFTCKDLLSYYPRTYEDRSRITPLSDAALGSTVCVVAQVQEPLRVTRARAGLTVQRLLISDGTEVAFAVFFNRPYLKDVFKTGQRYMFYGRVSGTLLKKELQSPEFEPVGRDEKVAGGIVPIYPLSKGLTRKIVSHAVGVALEHLLPGIQDPLPDWVREENGLASLQEALQNIHRPTGFQDIEAARKRLVFDELITLQLGILHLRQGRREPPAVKMGKRIDMKRFYDRLSFSLTNAQKRAVDEALEDLHRETPMNRLIQGDVGSGKTAVAAAVAYYVIQNGWQAVIMAPTEILAQQHYESIGRLLGGFGIRCLLLSGGMSAAQKRKAAAQIEAHGVDFIIGTHALVQEHVRFSNLGLVITDEQHRFGVAQRARLKSKGQNPHVLVMSATPIPRTLALIIYGDLDVSVIDEMPPGRRPVATYMYGSADRHRVYKRIAERARQGKQIYIVCPLAEEGEDSELADVESFAARLEQNEFKGLRVGFIHGRLKAAQKEAVIAAFARGQLSVLVATTVIEVGINVPSATYMVVENAERFGLSQLHQLRGRVGRGSEQSYCILFSDTENEQTRARLEVMCRTNDGFEVAQRDLELRGPGDFFGRRQHGLPELKIADMAKDIGLLKQAQRAAARIYELDPQLKEYALLKEEVNRLFRPETGELVFN